MDLVASFAHREIFTAPGQNHRAIASASLSSQAMNMTPRDWFILGLRLFGVWQLLYGLSDAVYSFSIILRFYRPTSSGVDFEMSLTFMHFIAAFYLLKFATQTADFFYPGTNSANQESEARR
jgi:uncharacterized membrane protein